MAFGRSYSSWRFRSRYGTRSTRRWRSGARRRALGNARAARQQRDASTVTISRIASVPVTITPGNGSAATVINHWNELRQSAFFPNYAPMYDQMKIEKIRAKFTGSRAGSAQTSNISPAVVLAFDRNGLSASQQVTTTTISTYSSAQLKQWSTGNAFSMYQTIYPSTIMEKGQYIPTESLVDPSDDNSSENPCSPYSDPQLPFKPITMIGVDLGGNVDAANTFSFTVEYEYTVTFRGMRKPSIAYDDVDLRPLSVSITSNGTYRYQPEDFDGYSEVTATVNVPPSEIDFDTISVYSQESVYDPTFSSFATISYNSQDWSQLASQTINVDPQESVIVIRNSNYALSGESGVIYDITLYTNWGSTTTSVNLPQYNYAWMASLGQPTYDESALVSLVLSANGDPMVYSSPSSRSSLLYTTSVAVDEEDLRLFIS